MLHSLKVYYIPHIKSFDCGIQYIYQINKVLLHNVHVWGHEKETYQQSLVSTNHRTLQIVRGGKVSQFL